LIKRLKGVGFVIQRQCVSSFRGKAIREWSSKLYEQVAKARKNDVSQRVEAHAGDQRSSNNQSPQMSDDPIKVLKIRFAKGEIPVL